MQVEAALSWTAKDRKNWSHRQRLMVWTHTSYEHCNIKIYKTWGTTTDQDEMPSIWRGCVHLGLLKLLVLQPFYLFFFPLSAQFFESKIFFLLFGVTYPLADFISIFAFRTFSSAKRVHASQGRKSLPLWIFVDPPSSTFKQTNLHLFFKLRRQCIAARQRRSNATSTLDYTGYKCAKCKCSLT